MNDELRRFMRHVSDDVRALNAELQDIVPTPSQRPATGRNQGEDAMQIELFSLIDAAIPETPALLMAYHVPNGGARSAAVGGRLKAMGVRRGVPDVAFDAPRGPFHGLRIELKMPGRKQTPEQIAWADRLRAEGYLYLVCYSAAAAFRAFRFYLALGPYRAPYGGSADPPIFPE